ncbi:CoA-transferase family III [Blastococcus sp. DSM 46786]|uniref:CoA transferase n=1 Tax=Blastococcus sp. DSM 46786 TaxID=1798227 RepID=UPI0008B1C2BA|nr:CoA transferase [Blastococcus sp. DSM 46786]SEL23827.1 CoA-transferase family III [Blastococcus sp. DSM 46786]
MTLPPGAAGLVDEVRTAVGATWDVGAPVLRARTGLGGALDVPGLAVGAVAAQLLAARALEDASPGPLSLDAGHVAASFAGERHVRFHGKPAGGGFAPLSRFWRTADGWVRLHGNYPRHRAAATAVLGEDVASAALGWRAEELETAVVAAGGAAAAVRGAAAWAALPQAAAVRERPLVAVARTAAHPGRRVGLRGLRVLDLTRVIAGPVATRALAAQGADVLRIDAPQAPDDPALLDDTGAGKRHVLLDLADRHDRARVEELVAAADVVVQGYRPGALDAHGLDPGSLAERYPHLVVARLSAWGTRGPWGSRRGFDSLVQAATGIAALYGGDEAPGALPVQALDHATGHLAAAAVLGLIGRQQDEGGGWCAELSLAATAHWLLGTGPGHEPPGNPPDPGPWLVELPSPAGPVTVVGPPGAPPFTTGALLPPGTRPRWLPR